MRIFISLGFVLMGVVLTRYVNHKKPEWKIIIPLISGIYILTIISLTLLFRKPLVEPIVKLKIHHWWKLKTSYLNILLFIPLGYLLPQVNTIVRKRTWLVPAIALGVSYTIEYIQEQCVIGWFDVNDILCNFIGAYIGLAVYEIFIRKGD